MKTKNTYAAALLLAACTIYAASAGAQTVYKCAGGYSQQPCPGGQPMTVADPRSDAQKAEAGAATRRDARMGDAMEKDRLRQEAQPVSSTVPQSQSQSMVDDAPQIRGKPHKPELFTAAVPGAKAARKAAKKGARSKKPKKAATGHKAA